MFQGHIILADTVTSIRERKAPARQAVASVFLPVAMKIKASTLLSYHLCFESEGVLILPFPCDLCGDGFRRTKQLLAPFGGESVGRSSHARNIISLRDAKGYLPKNYTIALKPLTTMTI